MALIPGGSFDASKVEPLKALEPIPAGYYIVKITESEMKPTSTHTDQAPAIMLVLTLEVIDGEYVGRKLFDRLNLVNSNVVAVEIAQKTLSAICRSTGVMQLQDSALLHGIPMKVKVKVRSAGKGKDGKDYDANNEIAAYEPVAGSVDGPAAQGGALPWAGGAPPATTPPPAGGAKPWETPHQSIPAPAAAPAPTPPPPPPPVAPVEPTYTPNAQYSQEWITWAKANPADPKAIECLKATLVVAGGPPWAKK